MKCYALRYKQMIDDHVIHFITLKENIKKAQLCVGIYIIKYYTEYYMENAL